MGDLRLTVDEINKLMDKLVSANLGELSIQDGEFKLKITAKKSENVSIQMPEVTCAQQPIVKSNESFIQESSNVKPEIDGNVMKSPIVGTFYSSVSPDKPPFVTVGSKVKKGDVLFIIESMKLMNEIPSEFDGEVVEILVNNAQGVEYNQPIMIIK